MSRIITSNSLNDTDRERATQLCGWFKSWKKQGKLPMKTKELCSKLNSTLGWDYNEHSFPSLLNYIRNDMRVWIVASNLGLDLAETDEDKKNYMGYLQDKISGMQETLNNVRAQYNREKKANQVGLFTEEKQVYGETIEDAIVRIGGRKVENL